MKDVIAVLKEQRAELLNNVARIDAAIAALGGVKPGRAAASGTADGHQAGGACHGGKGVALGDAD